MAGMVHRVVELDGKFLVLALHTKESPSVDEWAGYMTDYLAIGKRVSWEPELVGGLAVTDGGGPNAVQRQQVVNQLNCHAHLRGSVLTNSTLVRGIVTALSWLNADVKAFRPDQPQRAMEHLGLPPSGLPKLLEAIAALANTLPTATASAIADGSPVFKSA